MRRLIVLFALVASACSGSPAAPRAIVTSSSVSTPLSRAFSGGSAVLSATDRYCFLATIDDVDKRGDVVGMVRGNGSIGDLIVGRDPEPSDPSIFNRYVLKPSLLPAGSPEVQAFGGMGINTAVPTIIRREIDDLRFFWWSIEPGTNPLYTRPQLQALMLSEARISRGCTHYWQIVPGDLLTVAAAGQAGDLLSKFTAF